MTAPWVILGFSRLYQARAHHMLHKNKGTYKLIDADSCSSTSALNGGLKTEERRLDHRTSTKDRPAFFDVLEVDVGLELRLVFVYIIAPEQARAATSRQAYS